jgi:hypothetical protein
MTQPPQDAPPLATRALVSLATYFVWGAILAFVGGILYGIALTKEASYTFAGTALTASYTYVDKGRVWLLLSGAALIGVAGIVFAVATIAAGVRLAGREHTKRASWSNPTGMP